jgi:hypothetical protein
MSKDHRTLDLSFTIKLTIPETMATIVGLAHIQTDNALHALEAIREQHPSLDNIVTDAKKKRRIMDESS